MPELIYVSRLVRLPLMAADGAPVGRMVDVVVGPSLRRDPPQVVGFVASVQRRRIFVGPGRIGELGPHGARLAVGTVDLRRFKLREGETQIVDQLLDHRVGGEVVNDVAIQPTPGRRSWEVAMISLSSSGLLRRRAARLVSWSECPSMFDRGPVAGDVAVMSRMHPVEMAATIRALPIERRRRLAEAMEDERLADLLEELDEDEQVRIVSGLDLERAADVLEEMEADDAADLLAELSDEQRDELLEAMEPEEAEDLRRLLAYAGDTAGGMMTPEPVILAPTATVAEALARVRDPRLPVALAAHVFVTEAPTETPTGRYLGVVGYQRLLREAPATEVGHCLDERPQPIAATLDDAHVARSLAAYDSVAVPVVDADGRLVGAVTVDDVLDRLLPADWRRGP